MRKLRSHQREKVLTRLTRGENKLTGSPRVLHEDAMSLLVTRGASRECSERAKIVDTFFEGYVLHQTGPPDKPTKGGTTPRGIDLDRLGRLGGAKWLLLDSQVPPWVEVSAGQATGP